MEMEPISKSFLILFALCIHHSDRNVPVQPSEPFRDAFSSREHAYLSMAELLPPRRECSPLKLAQDIDSDWTAVGSSGFCLQYSLLEGGAD